MGLDFLRLSQTPIPFPFIFLHFTYLLNAKLQGRGRVGTSWGPLLPPLCITLHVCMLSIYSSFYLILEVLTLLEMVKTVVPHPKQEYQFCITAACD